MLQVTNLNRFRKQKARDEARKLAGAKAVQFGRTKGQKAEEIEAAVRAARHLDLHRRTTDEAGTDDAARGEDG